MSTAAASKSSSSGGSDKSKSSGGSDKPKSSGGAEKSKGSSGSDGKSDKGKDFDKHVDKSKSDQKADGSQKSDQSSKPADGRPADNGSKPPDGRQNQDGSKPVEGRPAENPQRTPDGGTPSDPQRQDESRTQASQGVQLARNDANPNDAQPPDGGDPLSRFGSHVRDGFAQAGRSVGGALDHAGDKANAVGGKIAEGVDRAGRTVETVGRSVQNGLTDAGRKVDETGTRIAEGVRETGQAIGQLGRTAQDGVIRAGQAAGDAGRAAGGAIDRAGRTLGDQGRPISQLGRTIGDGATGVDRAAGDGGRAIGDGLDRAGHTVGDLGRPIENGAATAGRTLGEAGRAIGDGLDKAGHTLSDLGQPAIDAGRTIDGGLKGLGKSVAGGLTQTGEAAGRQIDKLGQSVGAAQTSAGEALDDIGWDADLRPGIESLNSDGDQVEFEVGDDAKASISRKVVGVGGKAAEGGRIVVQQVGGADPNAPVDASKAPPASYTVTYDRTASAAAGVEVPMLSGTFGPRTADRVTFKADSKAEAERIVKSLQTLSATDEKQDVSRALGGPAPGVPGGDRGLRDLGSRVGSVVRNPATDPGARAALSAEDQKFLDDHMTQFSSRIGVQKRSTAQTPTPATVAPLLPKLPSASPQKPERDPLKLAPLGGTDAGFRVEDNADLTVTYVKPTQGAPGQPGQPGQLIYSTSQETVYTVRLGGQGSKNLAARGRVVSEMRREFMSEDQVYNLPDGAPQPAYGGQWSGALDRPDRPPDRTTIHREVDAATEGPLVRGRVDQDRRSIDVTVENPGQDAETVRDAVQRGDKAALAKLGGRITMTETAEHIRRDGQHVAGELGFSAGGSGAELSRTVENGVNDVVSRSRTVKDGYDLSGTPRPQPSAPAEPQNVVLPHEGLNVRDAPSQSGDKVGAFQHGEFVQPTGERWRDATGRGWAKVSGRDDRDRVVEGWVAEDELAPHPLGGADAKGRINPDLDKQGYRSHTLGAGDTLWDIAGRNGGRFKEILDLNAGHLIDPSAVFPGDKVYVPSGPGN